MPRMPDTHTQVRTCHIDTERLKLSLITHTSFMCTQTGAPSTQFFIVVAQFAMKDHVDVPVRLHSSAFSNKQTTLFDTDARGGEEAGHG